MSPCLQPREGKSLHSDEQPTANESSFSVGFGTEGKGSRDHMSKAIAQVLTSHKCSIKVMRDNFLHLSVWLDLVPRM